MLFKRQVLDGIAAGKVSVAFRRWARPSVRSGGRLRTAIGELAIGGVEAVSATDITLADARSAGFPTRQALLDSLGTDAPGKTLYRIDVTLSGPDRRAALREEANLGPADIADLTRRLDRMDAARSAGRPWTLATLNLIAERPGVPAAELAASLDQEKPRFKAGVRKLKDLGLTESLATGYRLSPRGRAFLDAVSRSASATT